MNKLSFNEKLWYTIFSIFVLSIFVCFIFMFRADGHVEYCYIQSLSGEGAPRIFYNLYGYRSWRVDNKIGIFDSFDDALKAANTMECPLKK